MQRASFPQANVYRFHTRPSLGLDSKTRVSRDLNAEAAQVQVDFFQLLLYFIYLFFLLCFFFRLHITLSVLCLLVHIIPLLCACLGCCFIIIFGKSTDNFCGLLWAYFNLWHSTNVFTRHWSGLIHHCLL